MLILLGLSRAFTAVSSRRAMSSEVKEGSKRGSVPVGWISICLSRTAAHAIAGVVCVGALVAVGVIGVLVFKMLL